MTTTNNNEDLEKKIIEAAKELFIENGFAETSMSDIAAKVGINRPALHYYFRTKDKMFQAVFGNIILSFIPKIHDIIIQQDKPVSESIGEIVDAYYKVFTENPCLPLFMVREMHRDMNHLSDTIKELRLYNPQIQISAESETKRSIFREKDKTKRSKKESAQHSKSRNKSFVMTSVSAL